MDVLKKIVQIALLSAMILSTIGLGMAIGVIVAYWNALPSLEPLEYETQSWHYPTKVYSDVSRISPGTSLEALMKRLVRLDYVQVSGDPTGKGQFHTENPVDSATNEMRLFLRELNYPRLSRAPRLISIRIKAGKIERIRDVNRKSMAVFILEPEAIAEFYGSEGTDRELVSLSETPETLTQAFIAIEDKRFYRHFGFDAYRIVGAFWRNFRYRGGGRHGASTITQQLARDLFLERKQRYSRKIKEVLLALKIERRYTKDEILERYLNRVNLGRYGAREVYGVREAARYYFSKDPRDLNLQECATLAGIPKDQTRYSPIRNPEKSRRRRQIVLRQMLRAGFISRSEHDEAAASPLLKVSVERKPTTAAYFLEYVRSQLKYEPSAIYERGLRIYTTLDMSMQLAADSTVRRRLQELDKGLGFPDYADNEAKWSAGEREESMREPKSYPQAALVSIDPSTGHVKAMVGGRDFHVSQFNRAVQSHRQPGSAFKPFVFCTAFANNLATPTTTVVDEYWEIEDPSQPDGFWRPKNFYERFYGQITVRRMLTESINVATARFMYENIRPDKVVDMARLLGIESPLAPVYSLALGSMGVTVLEITSAYGVWANEGMRAEPICIKYVLDREDNILEENAPPARRVLDKNVAFQVAYLMKDVIDSGTGRSARKFGFDRPAGGKTGTTNDETDSWFIGFVPNLVTGVWVGFDDYSTSVRRTGAEAALPIWSGFMVSAVDGPVKDFPEPRGIVFKGVDADTGLLATKRSTNVVREAFLEGTEPTED